jgi:hypothetical protein
MRGILASVAVVLGFVVATAESASASGVLIISQGGEPTQVAIRARGSDTWTGQGVFSGGFAFEIRSGGLAGSGLVLLSGVVTHDNGTEGGLVGDPVLVIADPATGDYEIYFASVYSSFSGTGMARIWKDRANGVPK